jgi:hypothetical protein
MKQKCIKSAPRVCRHTPQVFIDGKLKWQQSGCKTGHKIPSGGHLALGQELDYRINTGDQNYYGKHMLDDYEVDTSSDRSGVRACGARVRCARGVCAWWSAVCV